MMTTGDIGAVTVEGKDYRGSNKICFLGSADYRGRTVREGSAKKNS